jgi:hypothetical protein
MHSQTVLPQQPLSPSETISSGFSGLGVGTRESGVVATANGREGASTTAIGNRRRSIRYSAVNDRLWIGWWAGDEFVLMQARLINISEGGVLVGVTPAPAVGQMVWMRLEGNTTSESLSAVVLESRWVMLKRRYLVRLGFPKVCPQDFYEAALLDDEAPGRG